MKTRVFWCGSALLVIWAIKRYYSGARAEDLWWILSPTARLAGKITGASFAVEHGAGYLSLDRLFLIEKSCAGVNFMIAAFGMLTFVLRRRITSFYSGAMVLGISLSAAYAAAIMVNAARITFAMWLAAHPFALLKFSPAQIHRLEGISVYFAGMVLLYEVVVRLERDAVSSRSRA